MRRFLISLLLFASSGSAADKFEILRNSSADFAKVTPGKVFDFPADHGAHHQYRIEWWYLTANLSDSTGQQWGLQWTLFRQALSAKPQPQSWSNNQLWMAHAAISTPDGHHYEERFSRGGIGQAGITLDENFEAWIDDWQWRSENQSLFPSRLDFIFANREVHMQLTSDANWVLNGDRGYSQKSQQGQASYYYSQPMIDIVGTIDGVQLSGSAWLDREWSSQPLAPDQQGWDWFSLHLNDGHKIMLYRLRHDDGQHWLSGTRVDPAGSYSRLSNDDIVLSVNGVREIQIPENASITLPLDWQVSLSQFHQKLNIKPLYDQQWMGTSFPYWEGVVVVEDEQGNSLGRGYMELTGYE